MTDAPVPGKSAEQELVQIRRVGDRLRSAVRAVVQALPPDARGISGMARFLGIHKATCQRIVEGLRESEDAVVALTRLPGAEGLRMHLDAARRRGVPAPIALQAAAAIDEYALLLNTRGRTQSGLIKIIGSLRRTAAGAADTPERSAPEIHRRALFDAARSVTGELVNVKSIAALIRTDPANSERLRVSVISTLHGVQREPFSRPIAPFMLGAWYAHAGQRRGERTSESAEVPEFALLDRFSTTGLNAVPMDIADGRTLLVVDLQPSPEPRRPGEPVTLGPADVSILFVGRSKPNPAFDESARTDIAARVNQPSRFLIMDVLVDADLARLCRPTPGCYSLASAPGDTIEGAPEHTWHERFPEAPMLSRMTPAALKRPPELFPRQPEIIDDLLHREGLSASDLVAFRIQVDYPIWQSEYRLHLVRPESRADI